MQTENHTTKELDAQQPAGKGLDGAACSSNIVAEKCHHGWGICGWRLHEIKGPSHAPIAVLTSQSATIAGKISRKEVCALSIRLVGKNGKLEKINPYFV